MANHRHNDSHIYILLIVTILMAFTFVLTPAHCKIVAGHLTPTGDRTSNIKAYATYDELLEDVNSIVGHDNVKVTFDMAMKDSTKRIEMYVTMHHYTKIVKATLQGSELVSIILTGRFNMLGNVIFTEKDPNTGSPIEVQDAYQGYGYITSLIQKIAESARAL